MPPPTSPNRTPLLPASRDLGRYSTLMSRDFLNRMNELLANLLSQYTDLDPHETPHLTSLPAQIRNLDTPIRFLAIPDLDLDMDLDAAPDATNTRADTDTSPQFGHVASRARSASPSSALRLDSDLSVDGDSSDLDAHLDSDLDAPTRPSALEGHHTGLLHRIQLAQRLLLLLARQNHTNRNTLVHGHVGGVALRRQNALRVRRRMPPAVVTEAAARDLHGDFGAAIASIRSVDSYVGKSPLFAAHPHRSNGTRSSGRLWSSVRRPGRRGSLESLMERFLAHRRRGTLWEELERAERRGNAGELSRIVLEGKRPRGCHGCGGRRRGECICESEAEEQAEWGLGGLREEEETQGDQMSVDSSHADNHGSRDNNSLDGDADNNGSPPDQTGLRTTTTVPGEDCAPPSAPLSGGETPAGHSGSRSGSGSRSTRTHPNKESHYKASPLLHPPSTSSASRRPSKRRKTAPLLPRFVLPTGEKLDPSLLSRQDKYNILDGLPCLYFQSGSTFALDLLGRGRDTIDLSLSSVDWKNKTIHGHFDVKASGDRAGHIHLITGFLSFLCGGMRSRYTINCTNKVIQTKSALLDHAFMEAIVECGLSNPKVVDCLTSVFHIPFSGDIVDFNRNDLRFLAESRPPTQKANFSRSMHVSRVRNEQIKLQLGEWMRVRPFHNFSEALFLNYLSFIEKFLRNFPSAPEREQELGIDFASHMHELMHDITRGFQFVRDAKIPMVESRGDEARKDVWERKRHEPRSNLHKSSFVQEWESKMCEKLCDFVTCEDTCLLGVQLNYVLFTVKVDVSQALDQTFRKFIRLVTKDTERKLLQKKYDAVCKELPLPEARECIFVCSLNRKTGRVEMQNTRLNLDYKYAGSCDAHGSLLRDAFGSSASFTDSEDEDTNAPLGHYSMFPSHWKYLEDPYLMDNPTVTTGMWKRGGARLSMCSGGNGLVSFV